MALTRTASGVCVANLHATNDMAAMATEDVLRAARAATEFAGTAPLLFGGDLNLRPAEQPGGLRAPARGLRAGPRRPGRRRSTTCWPAASRCSSRRPPGRRSGGSWPLDGRALRLSDHAPVQARFLRQSRPLLRR